jgi:hypothetical protein
MEAMRWNELKDIFVNDEIQPLIIKVVGIALLIIFLVISQAILPENCYLFEYRQIGFLCDGISKNPQPCPDCKDERMVSVAQIIFGFGVVCIFLPVIVPLIRKLQSRPVRQTKLFD